MPLSRGVDGTNYGNIPAEHHARYDRYLNRSPSKVLAPDEWYKKAQTVWANNRGGNSFERAVRVELGVPVGAGSKPLKINGHIPDFPIGKEWGVTDVKDVEYVKNSPQLKAFYNYAKDKELPLNIIISPKTNSVSEPVLEQIRLTNGNLFEYDLINQSFNVVDIGINGLWKRKNK